MDDDGIERCACGRPLHYGDPRTETVVRELIRGAGSEYVRVIHMGTGKAYLVQRHYIALHGLRAWELPRLSRELGFVEVT